MKRTPEDVSFSIAFGQALKLHYDRVTAGLPDRRSMSDEQFAATLDVSRPALKKYLTGRAMPGLRTVVLAFRRYGIAIPYSGTTLFHRQTKRSTADPVQLVLPFSVKTMDASTVAASVKPLDSNRFELRVHVG